MTEINPPLALQGGAINHPAILFRRALSGVVREGVTAFNGGDKALPDDLKVNAGTGMQVTVLRGGAFIIGDDITDQGVYFVYNDASVNLAVAASDPSNDRKDIVVARVKDNTHGQAGDTWVIEVITGTPAASPVEPSLPDTAYKLATVTVPASSVSVTNGNIVDHRERPIGNILNDFSGAKAYRANTNFSINNDNETNIDFGTTEYDTGAFHNAGGNQSRLTAPSGQSNYYHVIGQIEWESNSTGRRRAKILVNGANRAYTQVAATSGGPTTIQVEWEGFLNEGEFVQLAGYQNSGGPLGAQFGLGGTWLAIRALGR